MSKRATLQPVADTATLRRVAHEAGRTDPPAVVHAPRKTVAGNIKRNEVTAIRLAKRAVDEGTTQKILVMRGLAAIGIEVDPLDLEDRTPRSRASQAA